MAAPKGQPRHADRRMAEMQDRIKERLRAVGKSARSASLEAGLSADAIRMILIGRSKDPRAETIHRLAAVLDCDADYLMGVVNAPRPKQVGESEFLRLAPAEDPLRLHLLRNRIGGALRIRLSEKMTPQDLDELEASGSPRVRATLAHAMGIISADQRDRIRALEDLIDAAMASRNPTYLDTEEAQPLVLKVIGGSDTAAEDASKDVRAMRASRLDLWALALSIMLMSPVAREEGDVIAELLERALSAMQRVEEGVEE